MHHFFGTRKDPVRLESRQGQIVVAVKQVHGTDTLVLNRRIGPEERFDGGWDALVTDQPGVLLTIRTADCVPVLLHEPRRRVVAALHAGWRGAVAGLVPRVIGVLERRLGVAPSGLRMAIGPAIRSCCYEVDAPVLDPLRKTFPGWRAVVEGTRPGKGLLDLQGLVRGQAIERGVPDEAIHTVRVCTACHPELMYSNRRDGGVRGTMISGIMLASPRQPARR
ncbi:MAG: polyphenol oxidase family protein [Nitrospirales bacterium]